jgi:signal transduction histidine kinase
VERFATMIIKLPERKQRSYCERPAPFASVIAPFLALAILCGAAIAQSPADGRSPMALLEESRERQRDYVEYLKKQASADPNNRRLRLDLGRGYYALAIGYDADAIAEAEKLFDQILAAEPENATALVYRGSLLGLKLGFHLVPPDRSLAALRQSNADMDRAVALAPDDLEVRSVRGYSSFYTPSFVGRDRIAVEDFSHIIQLLERQPGAEIQRAEFHLALGDAYHKAGEDDKARQSWRRVMELSPGASAAIAAESKLRGVAGQSSSGPNYKEVVAFFGFAIGAAIFAILSALLLRDFRRARRRGAGMWAALLVALAALAWNGLNLSSVVFGALGAHNLVGLAKLAEPGGWRMWRESEIALVVALSPIPFGLIAAYRFYKGTFMDIALKRGAALLVLFALAAVYGRLVALPASLALGRVSNDTLRWVFYTTVWLWLYALYPPLRDRIYRLVDRRLFKRRDYSRLLDWFGERLQKASDEATLIATACDAAREAFAAESARFVPSTDDLANRLAPIFAERRSNVLLPSQANDDKLERELAGRRVELALAIRAGAEPVGLILVGPRAYGQSYLSEELSVLRAVAAETGRTLDNLRLTEARRKQAVEEEELRKLVAQSELMALRAQINPHFFFNALNSVASLIAEDPPRAERLIENLAELFRHAFKPSSDIIPLEEELALVETYLEVEKSRLGDKLRFRKFVLPDALGIKIPALTIQPLIENAVKHGIGQSDGGGTITLSASLRDGGMSVIVADTGAGIAPTEMDDLMNRGVGLSNVNSRLVKLYGQSSRLRVDSAAGQGTTVSFSIPTDTATETQRHRDGEKEGQTNGETERPREGVIAT